jgi:high-affinity nickel-transport protein
VVLTGLLTELLGLGSGPVAWLGSIDLETFGFMVAGTMLGAWLLAVLLWRVALGKRRAPPAPRRNRRPAGARDGRRAVG